MNNIFKQAAMKAVPGSNHDLSHAHKLTFDIGDLVPSLVMEVLPGDNINMNVEAMMRMAPLVSPVMHQVNVNHHFFFVPNRILWPEWEDWITGKTEVEPPYVIMNAGLANNHVGTVMGYRPTATALIKQNALPLAAYAMIYDEYYRAQHIQTTEVFQELTAGQNSYYQTSIGKQMPIKRSWNHDYFTSALPWPQVGDAVTLPLIQGDTLDVQLKDPPQGTGIDVEDASGSLLLSKDLQTSSGGVLSDGTNAAFLNPNGSLVVDINTEAVTINALREALALQRFLESEARGGQRYVEHLQVFFNINPQDSRLQRPEYIGGNKGPMVISEVLTTAETTGNPVGNMQGHGISVDGSRRIKYRVKEHGFIIGITSVMPRSAYFQGLHRMFYRRDRYDYGNPMFARLGEQAINNMEIYTDGTQTEEEALTPFGYVPRYAEYKHINDKVSGEFRNTLQYWHMARYFTGQPVLSEEFLKVDGAESYERVFAAVDGTHTIYANIIFNIKAYRKLPKYGVPSII